MALFSAHDDFVSRSLSPLAGVWERLIYVAGLRNSSGRYEHWGLTQTHGRSEAQKAMAQAHSDLFQKTLATPIQELQPLSRTSNSALRDKLVPADMKGCSRQHMEYVLEALRLLSETEQVSRQVA
jgi:hypothetical protein